MLKRLPRSFSRHGGLSCRNSNAAAFIPHRTRSLTTYGTEGHDPFEVVDDIAKPAPILRSALTQIQRINNAIFRYGYREISPQRVKDLSHRDEISVLDANPPSDKSLSFQAMFSQLQTLDPSFRSVAIRRILIRHLLTPNDGYAFIDSFEHFRLAMDSSGFSATTPSNTQIFNSVVQRLKDIGVELTKPLILYGILLSSRAGAPNGVKKYINMGAHVSLDLNEADVIHILDNLSASLNFSVSHHWELKRLKQETLAILTGWAENGAPITEEFRQQSIWTLAQNGKCLRGPQYYHILGQLGSTDAIYAAWVELAASMDWRQALEGAIEKDSSWIRAELGGIIEAFLVVNDPERAWAVLRDLPIKPDMLCDATWSKLLDYPEFLTKWHPGMREPVLQKYSEYISNIENALGVQWSGGEDGHHVPNPEQESVLEILNDGLLETEQQSENWP